MAGREARGVVLPLAACKGVGRVFVAARRVLRLVGGLIVSPLAFLGIRLLRCFPTETAPSPHYRDNPKSQAGDQHPAPRLNGTGLLRAEFFQRFPNLADL